MKQYRVIYYLIVAVMLVILLMTIATDLGWLHFAESGQLFWVNFYLLLVVEWLEKKIKVTESIKGVEG